MFITMRTRKSLGDVRQRFEEAAAENRFAVLGSTMWGAPSRQRVGVRPEVLRVRSVQPGGGEKGPRYERSDRNRTAVPGRDLYGRRRSRPRDVEADRDARHVRRAFPRRDSPGHRVGDRSDDGRRGAVTVGRAREERDGVRHRVVCRELVAGLLTWVAFAVVVTAAVTFVAARRHPEAGSPSALPPMKSGAFRTGSRNSPGVSIRWSDHLALDAPVFPRFQQHPTTVRC